jgi:peroxiredoxin
MASDALRRHNAPGRIQIVRARRPHDDMNVEPIHRQLHLSLAEEFKQQTGELMIGKFKAIISAIALTAILALTASAQQDFAFTGLDGQSVSLASQRGKAVVLLFSGTQDPQCRDAVQALASLAERYQGKAVSIYLVSVNSANEASTAQLQQACGPVGAVTILRDANQSAFKAFSGKRPQLPTVVVLNKQGQLQGQPRGGFNPNSDFVNDLAAIIDGLLGK